MRVWDSFYGVDLSSDVGLGDKDYSYVVRRQDNDPTMAQVNFTLHPASIVSNNDYSSKRSNLNRKQQSLNAADVPVGYSYGDKFNANLEIHQSVISQMLEKTNSN